MSPFTISLYNFHIMPKPETQFKADYTVSMAGFYITIDINARCGIPA